MQAHETAYKLLELYARSRNFIKTQGTACKLMELHARLCNCMQAHGTVCKLGNLVEQWGTMGNFR